MGNTGTYEEKLPCSGKLQVTQSSWQIEYYFSGPDLRYNGDLVRVPSSAVEQYVEAFIENWHEYENLKASLPKGGEFIKTGKMGMSIRVGGYFEGVCIRSYHMPIKTKERLDTVVNGYVYALQRAPQIQEFLANL